MAPNVPVSFTFLNTGTTTWDTYSGYTLRCRQNCFSWQINNPGIVYIAPGQSYKFVGMFTVQNNSHMYTVETSVWQLWDPATNLYFGQQAGITIIIHGWSPVFQEASPSCAGDGTLWQRVGSAGSVACTSSGFEMAGGGSAGVEVTLQPNAASQNYGSSYYLTAHVHFTSSSPSTFAGIVLSTPVSGSNGQPTIFVVSPAGYYCTSVGTANCFPGGSVFTLPASSDYDFLIDVGPSQFTATANGSGQEGGIAGGGQTGLIEITAAGSSDAAYFSNYEFYQQK
jgi:hypothetical protein